MNPDRTEQGIDNATGAASLSVRKRVIPEINLSEDSFTDLDNTSQNSQELLSPRVRPKAVTPNSSAHRSLRSQFDSEAEGYGPEYTQEDEDDRDNIFLPSDNNSLTCDPDNDDNDGDKGYQ